MTGIDLRRYEVKFTDLRLFELFWATTLEEWRNFLRWSLVYVIHVFLGFASACKRKERDWVSTALVCINLLVHLFLISGLLAKLMQQTLAIDVTCLSWLRQRRLLHRMDHVWLEWRNLRGIYCSCQGGRLRRHSGGKRCAQTQRDCCPSWYIVSILVRAHVGNLIFETSNVFWTDWQFWRSLLKLFRL